MTKQAPIHVACDHAGYTLKSYLLKKMDSDGVAYKDWGCHGKEAVDYPDYAMAVINQMKTDENSRGLLICGSGIGMSIIANRFPFIRAGLVFNRVMAERTRQHNNANILCLGEFDIAPAEAWAALKVFLQTEFSGGAHKTRVDKITEYCGC